MQMRQLGGTDMRVGVLGFGGAGIGSERTSADGVARLLGEALDAGLNVVDTADCDLGREELIGRAIAGRRGEYYLFTRCGQPDRPGDEDWRPESLLASIERSLRRLRTDRVDLVQLHSCSEEVLRRGDAITALQEARRKGYARFIGYSGDGAAARYAIECGAFDAIQTSVSIADQESIDTTIPLAYERGLGIIARRPIAGAAWRYAERPQDAYHRPYWERLQRLDYEFLREGPETAAAVALRFTLSVPGVDTAIVGTARQGRYRENAALIEAGPLHDRDYEAIRARWRAVADAGWAGQA
jgi:aryl-alcohol dehydrogenase-like predicted oxidoreductase